MNTNVLRKIKEIKAKIIIFDIDGTLKDLCKEHDNALRLTLKRFNVGGKRRKIICTLNRIAMSMVKVGLFPTNNVMQQILLFTYSLISLKHIKKFYKEYNENYSKQICLFRGEEELLEALTTDKQIYFSTINKQNYNLEECGIPQERIVYTTGIFKWKTYAKLLEDKSFSKEEVLIVGDNIFDDLLSSKILKVKCLLVNNYNSKLKAKLCKLFNKST